MSEEPVDSTNFFNILERAMKAQRFSQMLDCFRQLKSSCKTIEKDFAAKEIVLENQKIQFDEIDFESLKNRRFVLLDDLIDEKTRRTEHISADEQTVVRRKSFVDPEIEKIIEEQKSPLEAFRLEVLLKFDHSISKRCSNKFVQSNGKKS